MAISARTIPGAPAFRPMSRETIRQTVASADRSGRLPGRLGRPATSSETCGMIEEQRLPFRADDERAEAGDYPGRLLVENAANEFQFINGE